MREEAVVFDVDGVLVDSSKRRREAESRAGCMKCPAFWRIFNDPLLAEELDEPRITGVELARRRAEEGYVIVVITGRPRSMRRITLKQLREIKVKPHILLMRSSGKHEASPKLKARLLENLIYSEGIRVAEIHDDDPEALHYMGVIAKDAALYLHLPGSGYEVIRPSPHAPRPPRGKAG